MYELFEIVYAHCFGTAIHLSGSTVIQLELSPKVTSDTPLSFVGDSALNK